MSVTNVLVVGVGGQGVLTASDLLAQAAMAQGFEVKKTEVAGMAQRGGVVSSHLRFGTRVLSPQIDPGQADILLAFEAAEALRWLPWTREDAVVIANTGRIVPPVVELGRFSYPDDVLARLEASGRRLIAFDAHAEALALGNVRLGNVLMLGAASPFLPLPRAHLEAAILQRFATKGEAIRAANARAFARGVELAKNAHPSVAG